MAHEEAVGEVFNVGTSNEVTIAALAEQVIERTGSGSRIRLVPYEEAYGEGFEELGRRKPDTSALERLTGWRPRRTVWDAIDDTIDYERWSLAALRAVA
jgi:UDP-glucose 4-epimerase